MLSRAAQHIESTTLERNTLIGYDFAPLPWKVLCALIVVYWWLHSHFWTVLKDGEVLTLEKRKLMLQLRAVIEH